MTTGQVSTRVASLHDAPPRLVHGPCSRLTFGARTRRRGHACESTHTKRCTSSRADYRDRVHARIRTADGRASGRGRCRRSARGTHRPVSAAAAPGAGYGEITLPERSALARLDSGGPAAPGALAEVEQITAHDPAVDGKGPRSARGARASRVTRRSQPRAAMSPTQVGRRAWRNTRSEQLARILSARFARSEVRQLMTAAALIGRPEQRI